VTIWKFPIKPVSEQNVAMPACAKILSVGLQDGNICLWAMVTPSNGDENRTIVTYLTGETLPVYPGTFIGTVVGYRGGLVLHVYDKR
jgi:hypothetical protein